jgi:hypothetical protein
MVPGENAMQELVESMVRFSTALTLFGVQQLQNAIELASDSQSARKKVQTSLDAITDALTTQLDESKRPAIESASNLVDKACDAFSIPLHNTRKLVDNATEVIRKTADTMADAIRKATPKNMDADEPVVATIILTAEG